MILKEEMKARSGSYDNDPWGSARNSRSGSKETLNAPSYSTPAYNNTINGCKDPPTHTLCTSASVSFLWLVNFFFPWYAVTWPGFLSSPSSCCQFGSEWGQWDYRYTWQRIGPAAGKVLHWDGRMLKRFNSCCRTCGGPTAEADVACRCHRAITAEHFQQSSTVTCGNRCAETAPEASRVFCHSPEDHGPGSAYHADISVTVSLLVSIHSAILIQTHPSLSLCSHSWGLASWFIYEL